jgi:ABC-type spermidine/putrescine transport system permease subunit I
MILHGRKVTAAWLLAPGLLTLAFLLLAPLANLFHQSLQPFVSGHVGAAGDAGYTLQNYADLLRPAYLLYIADTFRLSLIATVISVTAAFLLAFHIARTRRAGTIKLWLAFIIGMLFLSAVVRVYSINLLFSPTGLLRKFLVFLGIAPNGAHASEIMVVVGMVNQLLPIAVLTLIATIQNVNPRLAEAAQALGASRTRAHWTVTVPLCRRGLIGAFLLTYTLSLSSFVVPMVLGRGQVLFVSNLIYARFADLSNYPSGGALSISLLVISLIIVLLTARIASSRAPSPE